MHLCCVSAESLRRTQVVLVAQPREGLAHHLHKGRVQHAEVGIRQAEPGRSGLCACGVPRRTPVVANWHRATCAQPAPSRLPPNLHATVLSSRRTPGSWHAPHRRLCMQHSRADSAAAVTSTHRRRWRAPPHAGAGAQTSRTGWRSSGPAPSGSTSPSSCHPPVQNVGC